MSDATLSPVGVGERTKLPARNYWQILLGSLLGTCALTAVPATAAVAANLNRAPSFAARSLLLSARVEPPAVRSNAALAADNAPSDLSWLTEAAPQQNPAVAAPTTEPRQAAEKLATVVAEPPAPAEAIAAVQSSEYHVSRFKADIERLRRERWATPTAEKSVPLPVSQARVSPRSPVAPAVAPTTAIFPWLTLRGLEVARIASSSLNSGSGLDPFQAPVGKIVVPQLPPLGTPDVYLPESPDRFNGYIWPAAGTITSGYGYRWGRLHRGIDIAGPVGTPILAASSGEVIGAGWSGGYGKLVKLKHQDGSITYYAHNSRILVHNGQQVRQGQQIAALGNTGRSTGPHLHFEIHTGKGTVNPLALLPKKR